MFSLIWFRRENTKNRKNPLHIHPGPQIFILPIWEENWKEKREKWWLSTWITYSPLPSWCVIPNFFSFLFYFFILLWELACSWLVSHVRDLWVMSLTPCLFFIYFFNSFLLCSYNTLFWEKSFEFFLSSFYFIFFNEEIIHIYFFNKNIMYYFCFT